MFKNHEPANYVGQVAGTGAMAAITGSENHPGGAIAIIGAIQGKLTNRPRQDLRGSTRLHGG